MPIWSLAAFADVANELTSPLTVSPEPLESPEERNVVGVASDSGAEARQTVTPYRRTLEKMPKIPMNPKFESYIVVEIK